MHKVILLTVSGKRWGSISPPRESWLACDYLEQCRRLGWCHASSRPGLYGRTGSFCVFCWEVWLPCRRDDVEKPWEPLERERTQLSHPCQNTRNVRQAGLDQDQPCHQLSTTEDHIQCLVRLKSHPAETCPNSQPSKLWHNNRWFKPPSFGGSVT